MPIPLILGIGAAVAGAVGVGSGVHGAVKMKEAKDTMDIAERCHKQNLERYNVEYTTALEEMDKLGEFELRIGESFKEFADVFEQIKNRPEFKEYSKDGITLPEYDIEKLKEVSVGAGVLLGALGGASLGTAGGFAAAGAATAAVMTFGTASTGTAIASLSGIALTNATLAALGGGAIAAGGGGIALGTTLLGAATLGVGLMVGGVIFNFTGEKLSNKADEAWIQMRKAEEQIDTICKYLAKLRVASIDFYNSLFRVNDNYKKNLNILTYIVKTGNTDWNTFTKEQKKITENTVLLVGLLYNMCKVRLVLKSDNEDEMNTVNREEVNEYIHKANSILDTCY